MSPLKSWSLGLLALFTLTGCGASPRLVAKPPSSAKAVPALPLSLDRIVMRTRQDGWGLASGAVVMTQDGGRLWHRVTPRGFPQTSARLLSLGSLTAAFPTPQVGVIAQERATTIRVWCTNDSGAHWQVITWHAPPAIIEREFSEGSIQLHFMNAHEGLLLLSGPGNAGSSTDTLVETTTGGRQWQLVPPPTLATPYMGPSPIAALADISGLSLNSSGWGVARIHTVLWGSAWILTTTDGGRSWSSQTVPLPPGSARDPVYEGPLVVSSPHTAWLWLSLYQRNTQQWFLAHTTDGGRQWTRIPWIHAIHEPSTLGGRFLWPQAQNMIVGMADPQGTELWRWSATTGIWHRLSHLPVTRIQSVSYLSNGDGWLICGGQIFQTTNGGETWHSFSPQVH